MTTLARCRRTMFMDLIFFFFFDISCEELSWRLSIEFCIYLFRDKSTELHETFKHQPDCHDGVNCVKLTLAKCQSDTHLPICGRRMSILYQSTLCFSISYSLHPSLHLEQMCSTDLAVNSVSLTRHVYMTDVLPSVIWCSTSGRRLCIQAWSRAHPQTQRLSPKHHQSVSSRPCDHLRTHLDGVKVRQPDTRCHLSKSRRF